MTIGNSNHQIMVVTYFHVFEFGFESPDFNCDKFKGLDLWHCANSHNFRVVSEGS